MNILLIFSLVTASFLLIIALMLDKVNKRKVLLLSSIFYALFLLLAFQAYQNNKVEALPIVSSLQGSESSPQELVINQADVLDIKIKINPSLASKDQRMTFDFSITNLSGSDLIDFQMNFTKGLKKHFIVHSVRSEAKVYMLNNLISLGDLKEAENVKLRLVLEPINSRGYQGEIHWLSELGPILGKDGEPLKTAIDLKGENPSEVAEISMEEDVNVPKAQEPDKPIIEPTKVNDQETGSVTKPNTETSKDSKVSEKGTSEKGTNTNTGISNKGNKTTEEIGENKEKPSETEAPSITDSIKDKKTGNGENSGPSEQETELGSEGEQ